MAMRGVNDDTIHARRDQSFGALEPGIAHGRGRRDAQATGGVLGGVRVHGRLVHVFHGQQADAAIIVIHDDQTLDPMLVQQAPGFVVRRVHFHGHDLFRHQVCHRFRDVIGKARITIGDNADDLAALVHDRHAGKARALFKLDQITKARTRRDRDGVHHHAALIFLHHGHFTGLLFD